MERLSDEDLWSLVDRDAAELADYLAAHPEDRARVDSLRAQIADIAGVALPAAVGGYRVLGPLGEGGMGTVFRAEQPHPKRAVALKIVHGGRLASPRRVQLFEREAAALARLVHPGIATIYESGRTEDGEHFIAMELCDGRRLDEFIRERSPSRSERLELFLAICDALAHAHDSGVVHRDLKPSNVLVGDAGRPKIVDFGLARLTDDPLERERTQSGVVLGTLRYMGPEQAAGRTGAISARSDVWALGVILHELLVGSHPFAFAEHDLENLLRATKELPPKRLRAVDPSVDVDLESIVLCCLEKRPDDRYADAGEVAADLRRFTAGRPVVARPLSVARRLRLAARRNRAALVAAGALVVFATVAIVSLSSRPPSAEELFEPTAGRGYARRSPFTAVRWKAGLPEVEVDGRWWRLVAAAGKDVETLVRFCKVTAGRQFWSKRFEEDFVEVLTRVVGKDPGRFVGLRLLDLETGQLAEKARVRMTGRNRHVLWAARLRAPFTAVRWVRSRPRVHIGGGWFRVLAVAGKPIEEVLAYCAEVYRHGWRAAFKISLPRVLIELGLPPGPSVRVELEDAGSRRVTRDVPMTLANYRAIWAAWQVDFESHDRLDEFSVPKLAPWTRVQWNDDLLGAWVHGAWYDVTAIGDLPFERIVGFCRERFPKTWRARITEDLAGVLAMIDGRTATKAIELGLKTGETLERRTVPLTEENRELVRSARHREDRP